MEDAVMKFSQISYAVTSVIVRKALGICLLCGIALSAVSPAQAEDVSALGTLVEYNGHYYGAVVHSTFAGGAATWTDARDWATGLTYVLEDGTVLDGHLVTVQDAAEQNFVATTFVYSDWWHAWLGAERTAHDPDDPAANWEWVTGELFDYTNWDTGQPDGYNTGTGLWEDCVRMLHWFDHKWHDFPTNDIGPSHLLNIVVEFEPPIFSGTGFLPPVDAGIIKVSKSRTVPFKAELLHKDGLTVTDEDISAAPIIDISYVGSEATGGEYIMDDAYLVATDGNLFEFTGYHWQFNLKIKACCTASGTYTVTMKSGDPNEYSIASAFTAQFVLED